MCARVLRPWLPYPERAANWWVSERLTRNLSFVARMSSPLSFVRALRQEYCRAQRRLNAPCALVLKLFDVHLTIAEQRRNDNARGRAQSASSPPARPSLYSLATIAPLLTARGTRVVVLERPVEEETCSLLWAQVAESALDEHAWNSRMPPESGRQAALQRQVSGLYPRFRSLICPQWMKSPAGMEAVRAHHAWFDMVHAALGSRGAEAEWQHLNASYDENVRHHTALMGRIKQQWFADLDPAAHPRRPPLRVCNDQGLCWEV